MDIYEVQANEGAHLAFNSEGHLEPTTEIDFDEIDKLLSEESAKRDPIPDLSDAFAAILDWVWNGKSGPRSPRGAFVRFASLSAVMNPETLNNKSYKEIGAELGVTRAMISLHAKRFEKHFGIHFRRSRRVAGCEKMRQSRNEFYARKNSNPPS